MLIIPPPKFRKGRPPAKAKGTTTPPPPALAVVSASYDDSGPSVRIEFDRAIDMSYFDPTQLTVTDGVHNDSQYVGTDGFDLDVQVVTIYLERTGDAGGDTITLNATAETGIFAADDGVAWAGVTGMVLPFP